MVALSSTIFSLSPFSLTETLSRGTTATTENVAPSGFQHLVQPQAWLWATWLPIFTFTGFSAQLQTRVPPAKLEEPCFTPFARDGWIVSAIAFLPGGPPARTGRCGSRFPPARSQSKSARRGQGRSCDRKAKLHKGMGAH